ncbi:MAG: glycosyltransferase family 39 protein [Anaerolineae bacterium]
MKQRLLWLIIVLAFIRGLVYVSVIPPWQSPDEEFHYAQARLLLPPPSGHTHEHWQQELRDSLERFRFYELTDKVPPQSRFTQLTRNTPAYWLYALAAFPWIEHDVAVQLYAMRLISVLLFVGSVVLVYLTGKELFPDDTFVPLVSATLVLFVPQHAYINASLNDGNLAELAASAAFYLLARATMRGYSVANLTLILLSTALAIWAKQTALFLVVVIALAFAFALARRYGHNWRVGVGVVLGLVLIAILASQISYVQKILLSLWEFQTTFFSDPSITHDFWRYWLVGYRSVWASLGWNVAVDFHWWSRPALVLMGLALAGVLVFELRDNSSGTFARRQRLAIAWLGLSLLLGVLEFLLINAFLMTIPGAAGLQGRYLYVVALPFATLFAAGWRQLSPNAWRTAVALVFVVLFILFDCAILFVYQIPFFYPLWSV